MTGRIISFRWKEYQHMIKEMRKYGLLYLATPYSKYPGGIGEAFEKAAKVTAAFVRENVPVYSPIVHSHPLSSHGGIDAMAHDMWLPYNEHMMKRCDALVVIKMFTWEGSVGITYEIKWFNEANKPIMYFDPILLPEPLL